MVLPFWRPTNTTTRTRDLNLAVDALFIRANKHAVGPLHGRVFIIAEDKVLTGRNLGWVLVSRHQVGDPHPGDSWGIRHLVICGEPQMHVLHGS